MAEHIPAEPVVAAAGNWRYCPRRQPFEGGTYLVCIEAAGLRTYAVSSWNGVHWSHSGVTHWAPLYTPTGDRVCP